MVAEGTWLQMDLNCMDKEEKGMETLQARSGKDFVVPPLLFYRMTSFEPLSWKSGMEGPKLLTVKEAAEKVGCHEETIRRAYQADQLAVQPFGSRGIRLHLADLMDWMARGMPTRAQAA